MCDRNYCQHFSPMWPLFEQPFMKCLFSSMIQKLHFWQEDCLNLISTFYASYQNLTKSVLKRFSRYFRSFKRGLFRQPPIFRPRQSCEGQILQTWKTQLRSLFMFFSSAKFEGLQLCSDESEQKLKYFRERECMSWPRKNGHSELLKLGKLHQSHLA